MDLLQTVISRRVTTSVGVILVVMFGLIGVGEIPIQLTPQVDQPIITVTTAWPGRSPQEVVNEITKEQEEFLKNVRGLKSMRSDSKQGESAITLEFYVGSDLDRARQEVSDALRRVPEYPTDVDQPIITTAEGSAMNAIAWIILDVAPEARARFPEFDIASIQDAVDREFKPHLERIDGVAQVNVFGGREREVRVLIDARALASRDLNVVDLVNALRSQNRNISAGTIDEGKREFRVRLLGQYTDVDTVLDTVITYRDGRPVYVRDVADAEVGLRKQRSFVRSLSAPCLAVNAMRNTDANVVDIMREMRVRLAELETEVLPRLDPEVGPHLRLRQVYDETVYIDSSISLVMTNLVYGGVLAAVVLLLFLRSFISTGVIALAIPISVIGTFLVMLTLGRTLNVISLAGLAFAVGMVVDNAIVVLENIHRHRQAGLSSAQAAYVGAKEVWGAVIASTLTTAAVFVPILTVQEEAGQLFRDISIAIVASVLLSLTVSITVIPAACAAWLPDGRRDRKTSRPSPFAFLDRVAARVTNGLTGLLAWAIRDRAGWTVRPLIIVIMTVVSIAGAIRLMPPLDYLPAGNQNLVFGGLVIPPGQSMDQMAAIAERIEQVVQPYSEATIEEPATVSALPPIQRSFVFPPAYFDPVAVKNFFIAGFDGAVIVGATSQDPSVVLPLGSLLTNPMMAVPDSMGGARQTSIFGRGVGGGGTIDLEVSGTNLDRVTEAAQAMQGRAGEVFGFQAIRSEPGNFHLEQPEWRLRVNRRGRELGLTTEAVGVMARAMFDGAFVGDFLLDGDTVDLVVLPSGERYRDRLANKEQLASVPISTPAGPVVPMDEVVDVVIEGAPQSIRRIEELPGVTLSIQPPTDQPLEAVMRDIREQIVAPTRADGVLDPSMRVRLSGTAAKLDEVRTALFGAGDRETLVGGYGLATIGRIGGMLLLLGGAVVCVRRVLSRTREGMYAGAGALLLAVVLAGLLVLGTDQPQLLTARFVWALAVTYLLMCALFESFVLPFVIMFSVPLAVVGGFAGLAVVHSWTMADPTKQPQQFDVLTMIGFIILIGVVVNNAILIVHQTLNVLRANPSLDRADAVTEAVRSRVRPIFMSTMTSVGGMLPLVLVPGAGSEMYRGLGSVVIGGLICSTVFTLVLVPLLLSLVLDMRPGVAIREVAPVDARGGDRTSPGGETPLPVV